MAPELKGLGESSKLEHAAIERPGPSRNTNTNLREATTHASGLIIRLVQEAAAFAPCAELKQAAAVALIIFETIQVYKTCLTFFFFRLILLSVLYILLLT